MNRPARGRDRYATTAGETATVAAGIAAVIVIAWAISAHWPDYLTAMFIIVGAPFGCVAVFLSVAWAGRARRAARGRRLRLRWRSWPFPAVVITDTPRPDCSTCEGYGGWLEHYADHGDHGDMATVMCDCWSSWQRTLLAVPRRLAEIRHRRIERRLRALYGRERPF